VHGDAQQHDLTPAAARAFVSRADVRESEAVLEVGPGLGEITEAMIAKGAHLDAVEADDERVAHLHRRFDQAIAGGRLRLHHDDIRRWTYRVGVDFRIVSNPPFNLTAVLLSTWLTEELPRGPPLAIDLILQADAAAKLTANGSGGYTRSSVLTHAFGTPRIRATLDRADVQPPSRVDLCHWSLARREDSLPATQLRKLDRLLIAAFAGPHSVSAALRGIATGEQLRRQAAEHGWDPEAHPRTLTPTAWLSLLAILERTGKVEELGRRLARRGRPMR
jgi:16S rRNA (adenine1518-N6/adenine1519-N6)-dimethyltransferase